MEKSQKAILGAIVFVVIIGAIIGLAVHFTKDGSDPGPGPGPGPSPTPQTCTLEKRTKVTKRSEDLGENFVHCGKLIVQGNVPAGTEVTITEGDITITGNVLSEARIILRRLPSSKEKYTLAVNGKVDGGFIQTISDNIEIQGEVNNKGNITTQSGEIKCASFINSGMETLSGNIVVNNQIKTSKITTSSGTITCNNLIESTVNAQSENILVRNQIQNSKITTRAGNVSGKDITQSSQIETTSGEVEFTDITDTTVTSSSGNIKAKGTISASTITTDSGDVCCTQAVNSVDNAGDAIVCEQLTVCD